MEYNLWLQTELDDMKSCYQLIKTMTKFEEKTRHQFHKTTVNSAKCETIVRTHDTFCPLTQAWCVNCPFNCPFTRSNYKHDVYTVLLVHKLGWWTITFKNFVIVLIILIIATSWNAEDRDGYPSLFLLMVMVVFLSRANL